MAGVCFLQKGGVELVAGTDYTYDKMTGEVVINAAAVNQPITFTATGAPHTHTYDQQVVRDDYKVSEADCATATIYYKSCICGAHGTETFSDGEALGHDWGEPAWTWTEDCSKAEVTFTCKRDASHVEKTEAKVTLATVPATCTDKEVRTYTAEAEFNGQTYTDEKVLTGEALGHDWGESVWTWGENGTEPAVTFTCKRDASHTESPKVTYTALAVPATCTDKAQTVYSATTEFNGQTYTAQNIVYGEALGHKWSKPAWKWAEDGSKAKAIFTCKRDETHTEKRKAGITALAVPATCTEKEEKVYTATVEFDGKTYTDQMKLYGEALGHDTEVKNAKEPTATEKGYTGDKVCKVCGETIEKGKEIAATGGKEAPTTGDESNVLLWVTLLLTACAIITTINIADKKCVL